MNWAIKHSKTLATADTVNAFGVILYSASHANVAKVLTDPQYWTALDEVSGERWHIFAATAAPAASQPPARPERKVTLDRLSAVERDPKDNHFLLADFGLEASKHLPCLLIFGEHPSGEVFRVTIGLDDTSVEKAFSSLREVIGVATGAINEIEEKNFSETEGVFAAINLSVDSYKEWKQLKKFFPLARLVTKLFGDILSDHKP